MTITTRPAPHSASASAPNKLATLVRGSGSSVLQLSMRRIHDLVAFCLAYEFEDVDAA